MRHVWLLCTLALCGSCLDTALPTPPVLGPGVVRATVVTAVPGRVELVPAKGATLRLVGSSLTATADDDGNVTLPGITSTTGRLLFSYDHDGDGVAERSRVVALEAVRAGFGKDVNLGQVVLGRNSSLVGSVKRGDRVALPQGHGGIAVFLPQLPQLTYTGDDGSYVLGGVPEGNLVLNAHAAGYRAEALAVEVGPSREERVAPLVLQADPGAASVGRLSGLVRLADGSPVAAVKVRAARGGLESSADTNAEGRFSFETLAVGVYALGLEKSGLAPLRLDGVLVVAGLNEVGPFVMRPGDGTVQLDGGPLPPPDAGTSGGGSAGDGGTGGGSAGGGSAGGGSAGGGSAGGGSAGGGSAGGGSAGGGSAGGGSAGGGSAGGGSAGGGSAGGGSAGGGVAGGGSAAGGSAGGDAGVDGGLLDDGGVDAGPPLPLAVVGPPQTVAPNAIVTLNGMASTGDFPLSYGWTQIAGPAVSLSQNNSVTAHSPIFRALVDAGTVLEFALVVTDRYNRLSVNPAVARVNVGSVPVARFVPDGGLVLGGTTLAVQSTSFDDGGLVLVNHDWRLGTGSAATLVADGGRTAWVTFDAVPFGAPDRLASVELSVTNAIGATSPVTSRVFTVRGANPDNWAIDAGPNTPITVGLTPPTVNLRGSFTTTVPAPTPAWSWSCVPPVALLNPDTLTPSFVAPAVQGPPLLVTCTLTGTAQPPLNPAQLSAAVQVQLLDGADPQLAAVQPGDVTRSGPFGFSVRFDEPLSSASSLVVPCSPLQGWTPQVNGPHVLFAPTTELDEGASCTSASLRPSDTAGNAWTSDLRVRNGFIIRTEWEGPFVSSTSFANPRPVVATLGTYSTWAQQAANVPSPRPSPVELLVIEDGGLWRFPAFDPLVVDAGCGPGCVLSASPTGLAGLPEEPPAGRRAFWAQASMYVVTSLDGGVATLVERSPTGLFSVAPPPPGAPMQGSAGLRALTVDGGQLQGWFLDGSSWRQVETIANGLGAPNELVGFQDFVTGTFGPTSQFTTWTRNTTSWTTRTPTSQPAAAASNLNLFTFAGLYGVVYTNPSGVLRQYRLDGQATGFDFANSTTPVQGFDVATRGGVQITVLSENGNVRLHTFRAGSWAGSGVSYQVFPGPPRVGFTPPYPAVLDLDPSCEAAWPRLAFVEDALVVTWQERCVPEVRWRVVARIIR